MATVRADKIYKIFGRHAKDVVTQLENGVSRDELQKQGATPAVINASFQVREGETFVVMGLSGSGKSTLIRTLNGLLPPTSGHVYVDDQDITTMPPKDIRQVRQNTMSMVFQHFALFPHRTIMENASYGLRVRGMDSSERREKGRQALELVGLKGWENHYPRQLSGGMQQRVGLARALAAETDVLLMDEAFSALDPLIRRDMQDQLIDLQHKLAKTIIFITHDLNEAMRLGDRIAVMRDGEIVQIGTTKQILDEPADDYVAQFVQDVDRSRVLTAGAIAEQITTIAPGSETSSTLELMRGADLGAVFVVDDALRLVGALSYAAAAQAAGRSERWIDGSVDRQVPTTPPEAPIVEVFEQAAGTELPVAVVKQDGTLLGALPRTALLRALGKQATSTNHQAQQGFQQPPAGAVQEAADV
ncbi:MAG: betaine/proline/choline family ABC transporter ATP-binding protein [Pseudonocardiaceae bacterium]|nr:betaine/proline/choline family ABC transporter ATP-binding protein [Pseudonocardiaceae bacterium]